MQDQTDGKKVKKEISADKSAAGELFGAELEFAPPTTTTESKQEKKNKKKSTKAEKAYETLDKDITEDTSPAILEISDNARKVLERRYLKKDDDNDVIEEPEDMFRRVAHNIASADVYYNPHANVQETEDKFYRLMTSLEFIPNSPTLMNAGRDLQQLSACFVLPVDDSMEDIFDTVRNTALIHKSGGGTGFSFSRLRPKNSRVRTTRGASSGPISFMQVFNAATEVIKQGGVRRGANMGILRVDHPDIEDFIECKKDKTKLTNFNISVAVTDAFMHAADNGTKYWLKDPRDGKNVKELDAKKIFDRIVEMAHSNGEPGIVFIDKINAKNPTPHAGEIESTNPCGEQPLLPYESCNLGSINLSRMVKDSQIDFARLRKTVHNAVHFLDNVIDMNRYPLEAIDTVTKSNRKIGLGIMGFADMLIQLGISYNSEQAAEEARRVMKFIDVESKKASATLAQERGAFPNFEGSIFDKEEAPAMRNATTTTIAPTGTISIIASSSSGIEPLFAVSYVRTVMDKDELAEVNPYFKKLAESGGFYSDDLMKRIARCGTIQDFEEIPEEVRRLFVTAHDITPEDHIRIQAAFQDYTDNAVSKTVNFTHDASVEDVRSVYKLAYDSSCKGVTIYRDGSRDEQVLSVKKEEKSEAVEPVQQAPTDLEPMPRDRPAVTFGRTDRVKTGCGKLYVTLNEDVHGPCEVFTQMGKAGGCAAAQSEAISRLISLCLRSGINEDRIMKHLRGIRCHSLAWDEGVMVTSCPDALGMVLERYIKWKDSGGAQEVHNAAGQGGAKIKRFTDSSINHIGSCPSCGGVVEHSEGCVKCHCGWSKC